MSTMQVDAQRMVINLPDGATAEEAAVFAASVTSQARGEEYAAYYVSDPYLYEDGQIVVEIKLAPVDAVMLMKLFGFKVLEEYNG